MIITNLNCDSLYLIFLYLSNYELSNLCCLCKYIKYLYTQNFFLNIIYNRKHPIVFNILDNYCILCNINKFNNFFNKKFIRCKHHKFN